MESRFFTYLHHQKRKKSHSFQEQAGPGYNKPPNAIAMHIEKDDSPKMGTHPSEG